jgi:hypothetical protein
MTSAPTGRDAETLHALGLGDEDLAAWQRAGSRLTRSTTG